MLPGCVLIKQRYTVMIWDLSWLWGGKLERYSDRDAIIFYSLWVEFWIYSHWNVRQFEEDDVFTFETRNVRQDFKFELTYWGDMDYGCT